ncbi:DUF4817 domain-containing protein [Trichonephila clavipes]|nr:DUF4817 domain-containing protein [Trichonephila clavipes]
MANNQSVRRHLDAFTRGRIIGKFEEGHSVTSMATEFGIAHSIVSRLWKQFQTTGTAIRGSVVVVHEEPRPQMTGTLSYRQEETGDRQREKSLDTRHRRRSLWCREHRNWRDNEWGRVLFTDESRFSLSSDSHRILIWRERGSRNHPSNIIERDRYGGRGVLVWGGIMLDSRTDLHIFDAGSVNGTRYCNEILLPYVRLFRGAMDLQFLFMDDNAPCHRIVTAEQLLESRRLSARTLPPVTIRELRLALQDEWAAMPQQLIDTLILSMGRRCETCLAKNVKIGKGPLTPAGLLKLVKRFEETGKLEDRARAGRPCLKEARVPCIAVEMEAIASEAASGTNSAREAARRLGLPPSSVRNILRRILQLYPYKLQSCHEFVPADTAQWEAFAKWAFSKMEQDISRFMVTLTITLPFGRPLIHVRPIFETQCPVNGWITEAVNAQRYLTLLRETAVPCLIQRGQIANVTFMQDGATSHTANPVKAFLIQTFGEDRIVSRRYPWPPRFPDLKPADFWLWGYLKSRLFLSGPSSLLELKDAIRREVSSIHPDVLHSAVAGFVTRLLLLDNPTINSEAYGHQLDKLNDSFKQQIDLIDVKFIEFLQDNARPKTSLLTH